MTALFTMSALLAPAASAYEVTPGPSFNDPLTDGEKTALLRHVDRAIYYTCRPASTCAPGQETILISAFLFDREVTKDRLIAAHKRGVNVQVVLDADVNTPQAADLKAALGPADKNNDGDVNPKDRNANGQLSFAIQCVDSCRGDRTGAANHAKFYSFSRTGTSTNVVMVHSANLNAGAAEKGWNDLFTFEGAADVYDLYRVVHRQMARDRLAPGSNPYAAPTDHPYVEASTISPQGTFVHRFFPMGDITGDGDVDRGDDPVHKAMRNIECSAGAGGPTVVQVAMFWWTGRRGIYLAEKLLALAGQGCQVEVIYGAPSTEVSKLLRDAAHAETISLWDSRIDVDGDCAGEVRVHHKFMLVDGTYDGDSTAHMVFTGSANWIAGAMTKSDENMLDISSESAHDAYAANFESIKDPSRTIGGDGHEPKQVCESPPPPPEGVAVQ